MEEAEEEQLPAPLPLPPPPLPHPPAPGGHHLLLLLLGSKQLLRYNHSLLKNFREEIMPLLNLNLIKNLPFFPYSKRHPNYYETLTFLISEHVRTFL